MMPMGKTAGAARHYGEAMRAYVTPYGDTLGALDVALREAPDKRTGPAD
jgi:hypothetical protein